MDSQQISWSGAFWFLPPLAINSMTQPGRVSGSDPSLRTYLRSSPIVCAFDTIVIIIRFLFYIFQGDPASLAAKKVKLDRGTDDGIELGGIRSLERLPFVRGIYFLFGGLFPFIKLMGCTGIPWTQTFGCCYLISFVVAEGMNILAAFANEAAEHPETQLITLCERGMSGAAMLVQLALLAWADLAGVPPDPILSRRWAFRAFRFSGHFIVFLIYLPLILTLQPHAPGPSPNRRLGYLVLSILLILIILVVMNDFRFSQLYFIWSIIISGFSWGLYFFPMAKKHVLLCEAGSQGYGNVVAFDFFCRVLGFSLFWYILYYNPEGTFKPKWTEMFG